MTPGVASQIFSFLFEKEKPLYRATLDTLAKKRNLRPVFVERKPREERFAWLKDSLASAIDTLLSKHDAAVVSVYLHTFQALHEEGGWPTLGELLETDARLKL